MPNESVKHTEPKDEPAPVIWDTEKLSNCAVGTQQKDNRNDNTNREDANRSPPNHRTKPCASNRRKHQIATEWGGDFCHHQC